MNNTPIYTLNVPDLSKAVSDRKKAILAAGAGLAAVSGLEAQVSITLPSTTVTGLAVGNNGSVSVSTSNNDTIVYNSSLQNPGSPITGASRTDTGRGITDFSNLQIDTSVLRLQNLSDASYSLKNLAASFKRVGDTTNIGGINYQPLLNQSTNQVFIYDATNNQLSAAYMTLPGNATDLTLFNRGSLANSLLVFSDGTNQLKANYITGATAGTVNLSYNNSYFDGVQRMSINDSGLLAYTGIDANVGGAFIGFENVSGQLNGIAAIPEPSTYALLFATGAALAMKRTREGFKKMTTDASLHMYSALPRAAQKTIETVSNLSKLL